MSSNDQSTPLELDLQGYTARQYAALILRDELRLTYGRAGIRLGVSRDAFNTLYRRAKIKEKTLKT